MQWYVVARFPLSENLITLHQWLDAQGFLHRITEEGNEQVLWVGGEPAARHIQGLFAESADWYTRAEIQQHSHHNIASPVGHERGQSLYVAVQILRVPITVIFILLGLLGALLVAFEQSLGVVHWFTFQDFITTTTHLVFSTPQQAWEAGQIWRLLTPVFLHFSAMHIIFNALWMWEFGRRVEGAIGSLSALSLYLAISITSNLAQYMWSGVTIFGGLSGVVYGLLGFCWMRQRFYPGSIKPLIPGIIGFMLVWLFLGMSGMIDIFMTGSVANAAHASGLLVGIVFGLMPIGLGNQSK